MNKIRFQFGKIPDGKDICQKQLLGLVDKIANTDVNHKEIDAYLPAVYEALDQFDKKELINRFISAEFNRFLEYYRKSVDINIEINGKKPGVPVRAKNSPAGKFAGKPAGKPIGKANGKFKAIKTQRFLINFGRMDKINEGTIVRFICEKSGIRSNMIGAINLDREFSFFEVNNSAAGIVNDSMKNARLDGRQVRIRKVV